MLWSTALACVSRARLRTRKTQNSFESCLQLSLRTIWSRSRLRTWPCSRPTKKKKKTDDFVFASLCASSSSVHMRISTSLYTLTLSLYPPKTAPTIPRTPPFSHTWRCLTFPDLSRPSTGRGPAASRILSPRSRGIGRRAARPSRSPRSRMQPPHLWRWAYG